MALSFFSDLAGSSVPVESAFLVYKSETLGNLQSSNSNGPTNDVRCGNTSLIIVSFLIGTNILNGISVYQSTSIDCMFV